MWPGGMELGDSAPAAEPVAGTVFGDDPTMWPVGMELADSGPEALEFETVPGGNATVGPGPVGRPGVCSEPVIGRRPGPWCASACLFLEPTEWTCCCDAPSAPGHLQSVLRSLWRLWLPGELRVKPYPCSPSFCIAGRRDAKLGLCSSSELGYGSVNKNDAAPAPALQSRTGPELIQRNRRVHVAL